MGIYLTNICGGWEAKDERVTRGEGFLLYHKMEKGTIVEETGRRNKQELIREDTSGLSNSALSFHLSNFTPLKLKNTVFWELS